MSPRPRIYKKAYAFELLAIAKGDLESARLLATHSGGRLENIAYLAHQAVEKALKALLCYLGQPVPFTHDVAVLRALVPSSHQPAPGESLESLTEFALMRRYEENPEILSIADFQIVIQETEVFMNEISLIIRD